MNLTHTRHLLMILALRRSSYVSALLDTTKTQTVDVCHFFDHGLNAFRQREGTVATI